MLWQQEVRVNMSVRFFLVYVAGTQDGGCDVIKDARETSVVGFEV